jgi:hypothetical protein
MPHSRKPLFSHNVLSAYPFFFCMSRWVLQFFFFCLERKTCGKKGETGGSAPSSSGTRPPSGQPAKPGGRSPGDGEGSAPVPRAGSRNCNARSKGSPGAEIRGTYNPRLHFCAPQGPPETNTPFSAAAAAAAPSSRPPLRRGRRSGRGDAILIRKWYPCSAKKPLHRCPSPSRVHLL